jgi:hypothetical protein
MNLGFSDSRVPSVLAGRPATRTLQTTQGDLYNLTTSHTRWTTWWRLSLIRGIPLFRLTVILVLVFVAVSHGYGASLPTPSARHTAGEVLLVYNADSPISTAIAKEYAGTDDGRTVPYRGSDCAWNYWREGVYGRTASAGGCVTLGDDGAIHVGVHAGGEPVCGFAICGLGRCRDRRSVMQGACVDAQGCEITRHYSSMTYDALMAAQAWLLGPRVTGWRNSTPA